MGRTKVNFGNNKQDMRCGTNGSDHCTAEHGINIGLYCPRCQQHVIKKVGMSAHWVYLINILTTGTCPNRRCNNRISEDMFECIWFAICRYEVSAVPEHGNEIRENGDTSQLTRYAGQGNYGRNRQNWNIRLKASRRE